MTNHTAKAAAVRAKGLRVDAEIQAIAAALLVGAFLVFGAGFANSAAMHSAAHDSRHSVAFPCH